MRPECCTRQAPKRTTSHELPSGLLRARAPFVGESPSLRPDIAVRGFLAPHDRIAW